jgi:hypothetical protein
VFVLFVTFVHFCGKFFCDFFASFRQLFMGFVCFLAAEIKSHGSKMRPSASFARRSPIFLLVAMAKRLMVSSA